MDRPTRGGEPLTPGGAPPTRSPPEGRAAPAPPTTCARLRVLVVDDDSLVRDVLVRMLPASRFEVTTATCAEEVPSGAALDVLVTDLVLPGEGGVGLADRLQAACPGLAVVLVSGFAPELHSDSRVTEGAWVVVEKPFRARDLLEAVERAVDRAR